MKANNSALKPNFALKKSQIKKIPGVDMNAPAFAPP